MANTEQYQPDLPQLLNELLKFRHQLSPEFLGRIKEIDASLAEMHHDATASIVGTNLIDHTILADEYTKLISKDDNLFSIFHRKSFLAFVNFVDRNFAFELAKVKSYYLQIDYSSYLQGYLHRRGLHREANTDIFRQRSVAASEYYLECLMQRPSLRKNSSITLSLIHSLIDANYLENAISYADLFSHTLQELSFLSNLDVYLQAISYLQGDLSGIAEDIEQLMLYRSPKRPYIPFLYSMHVLAKLNQPKHVATCIRRILQCGNLLGGRYCERRLQEIEQTGKTELTAFSFVYSDYYLLYEHLQYFRR